MSRVSPVNRSRPVVPEPALARVRRKTLAVARSGTSVPRDAGLGRSTNRAARRLKPGAGAEPHRRRTRRRRRKPSRARERAVVSLGRPGRAAVPPGLGPEARGRASARSPRRRRAVLGCGRQNANAAQFPLEAASRARSAAAMALVPPRPKPISAITAPKQVPGPAPGDAPGALGTPRARVVHSLPARAARRVPGVPSPPRLLLGAPAVGGAPCSRGSSRGTPAGTGPPPTRG